MIEQSKIHEIKGVGEKTEKLFAKLGIYTVGDLLRYYPRNYDVYEEAVPIAEVEDGRTVTVTGMIFGRVQVGGSRNLQVTTIHVKDLTGTIKAVWFRMPFLKNTLAGGSQVTLRGRAVNRRDGLVLEHPEIFYPSEKYEEKLHTLQPIYNLTAGLTNNAISKAVKQVIESLDLTKEHLPEEIRLHYQLAEYNYAIRGIHFPEDKEVFYHARERLVFEEFLQFILAIRKLKDSNSRMDNEYVIPLDLRTEEFQKALPFELTRAQQNVWREIQQDMASAHAMSRLVQGDVGSGKTIVAVLALLNTALKGYQAAMMAPTEVLARQHAASFRDLLEPAGITVVLLTGSLTAKEKRERLAQVADGTAQMVIGTHAVIQKGVEFQKLGLAITDEQHRFGVRQRSTLAEKGENVHTLVMTATPIPRTLALILYGDLDISIIDELPPGRQKIDTSAVDSRYHPRIYAFIEKHVAAGRQAYVICPMIEENEKLEVQSVLEYTAELTEELPHCRVACVHGKMKAKEKQTIMDSFAAGEIDVLVSTTVVEVGINVPNATIMLIENAERFGLAQLHQLRGRVGRGAEKSYCILVSDTKTRVAKERMKTMTESEDGFVISEKDLKLRGPGEFFGIRQHGLPELKIADLCRDLPILKEAQAAAAELLRKDRNLEQTEHQPLKARIAGYLDGKRLEM